MSEKSGMHKVPVDVQIGKYCLEIEVFSQFHGGEFLCFLERYLSMEVLLLGRSFLAWRTHETIGQPAPSVRRTTGRRTNTYPEGAPLGRPIELVG